MKAIHKLNGGNPVTLCHTCRTIISTGFTDDVLCEKCKAKPKQKNNHTEKETLELMRLAFEAGFKQADFVEAGLEGKETESIVHWIYIKETNKD
jgi:hypothetical protein